MPAPILPAAPVAPWRMYGHVQEIARKGFRSIEVEAIAIERDPGGKYYCARVICSPEDGLLQMCSVYLREEGGGALCIADLPTKEEAFAYAAEVSKARGWQVHGSIYDLRIREVPGKGYLADPRHGEPFTLDPAMAALYHAAIAKEDLFVGGPGEHGRWMAWFDASNHAVDRAAEKEALLGRVFNAAMEAMGTSAPARGSNDANRLREMLKVAVEANRSDRLVVFDADQRSVIREALDEVQFDLAGHESDEELCEVILSTSPRDLFGEMAPDSELALLKAFATEGGVAAINAAVQRVPGGQEAPMLKSIHRRLERHGLESPFAHHFAEAESDTALAPRG